MDLSTARVIVTEPISPEGMETLAASVRVEPVFEIAREALLERVAEFDGIVVRSCTVIDRELLDRADRLKVVGRAGVGVDNIDIAHATSRGVLVVNAPESNTISAAEHTLALMLAVARDLPRVDRELRGGRWKKAARRGVELYGKTLGIVGLGRVGSTVAVRAAAFGMKVIAYDPYIARDRFEMFGAERIENLDELISRSDYLTLHTPKTEETTGMIGGREIALAPDGVRIINCARGGIVDEAALVSAIESGKVAGAGIDVFDGEPTESHPFFTHDRIVVTPHLGGSTEEAQVRVGVTIAEQVVEALSGALPMHALNVPLEDVETLAFVKPFLPLAEAMGSFYTQLFGLPAEGVEVGYAGEIGRRPSDLVGASLMKGLLVPVLGERVNIVNARGIAESRGLRFAEARSTRAGSYTSLLTVRGSGERAAGLSGTLVGRDSPRITEIDGFEVDLGPAGDAIVAWYDGSVVEEPGVVGRVGTMLGEFGVNIGRMEVGREIVGGRAIMVISPSGDVPRGALEALRAMRGVLEARLVSIRM